MKKILSALLALVMIISCMAITVSAAGITIGPLPNIDCVIAKAPSATGMTDNEWTLLRETNQVRWNDSKNGPLTTFSKLNEAAGIRAEELPKLFSHTRPNGTSCTTVIAEVGLPETAVGENIASMSSADDTPAQVVDIWRNSPGHYATMMGNWNTTVIEVDEHGNQTETKRPVKDFYRHMGVGQYTNDWVQVFYSGNPSSGEYTEDELEMFGYDECCNYTKLSITKPSAQFSKGTSITDMNLIGVLTCDKHGQGYFPVLSEYCSGYDANKTGKQTVTVTVYGLSSTVDVNIKGSVEPQPTEPTPTQPTEPKPSTKFPFTDVKSGTWYYNAVKYTYDNGLMNGVSDTKFDPEGTMTRGMLVTVLYRYDGSPSVSGKSNPFKDVKSGAWYTDAVKWAYANGITMGTSATKFSPDDKITREQIVTIFYRYADYKNLNVTNLASLSGYKDAGKVADYAKTAFQWAVANGIVNGTSSTTLSPRNNATRAECATIIQRFAGWANEGSAKDPSDSAKPTEPETTKPTVPEETVPKPTEPEETKPSETVPEETKPDVKPTEPTEPSESTQPDETVPEETKPTETVPDETEPEVTTPTEPEVTEPDVTTPTEPEATEPTTHEHTPVREYNVAVTCGADGYNYWECACGHSEGKITEATQKHTYKAVTVEATDTMDAYKYYVCTTCGDSTQSNYTCPNGCDYVTTVIAPTKDSVGYTLHECTRCGETKKTDFVHLNGDHEYIIIVRRESGWKITRYKCVKCEHAYEDVT